MEAHRIEIVGEFEVIPDFKLPLTYGATREQKQQLAMTADVLSKRSSLYPILNHEKCIQCGDCITNCPAGALVLEPFPTLNPGKCITCYCCAELCTEAAMEIPEGGGFFF